MDRLRHCVRWFVTVGAVAALAMTTAACTEAGAGACVKNCVYGCSYYCQDFHDTSSDTGAELCGSNDWTEGQSCDDLGYTTDCGNNVKVQGSASCP
jgi:hypothetical protein